MTATARTTALQVLCAMKRADAWADAALKAQITRDRLSPQDAALCTRLVYGVLQNRMLLDFWLTAYCTQKPDHLQFPLLDILRLGAYQIVFLDKIPDSAAVNESVNLARQAGRAQARVAGRGAGRMTKARAGRGAGKRCWEGCLRRR